MQAPVEICYAGVVIARAEEVREGEGGEFFIVMKDPLPVGTLLGVRSADSLVSARVLRVVESADGAESGMQVRPAGLDEAGASLWIPPPPAAKPAAVATPAKAAVAPPAAKEPALAEAAPAEAAVVRAEPELASAPVASAEPAVDAVSVGKEEPPTSAQTTPAESAAPAGSPDGAGVPEAVPAAVGSSLTGALKGVVASESGASGAVETSGEASAPADEAPAVVGDLPPARPVQGSGGRRRTKRRR